MKRFLNKWAVLAMILALLLALSACNAAGAPDATDASTEPETSAAAEPMEEATEEVTTAPTEEETDASTEPEASTTAEPTEEATEEVTTAPTEEETEAPTEAETEKPKHTHSYTDQQVAATCTGKGYTKHTCSCGSSYTDKETAALGHSWGDWVTVSEADYNNEGKKTHTCSRCGAEESQTIPRLEMPALEWSDLDLNKAMQVGNDYAVSKWGCIYNPSLNADNAGYDFPIPLSKGEILMKARKHTLSYQDVIEREVKMSVDSTFKFENFREPSEGAWVKCHIYIQNNQLWFCVYY